MQHFLFKHTRDSVQNASMILLFIYRNLAFQPRFTSSNHLHDRAQSAFSALNVFIELNCSDEVFENVMSDSSELDS